MLLTCLQRRDYVAVEAMINNRTADMNETNKYGWTPLMEIACKGRCPLHILQSLLQSLLKITDDIQISEKVVMPLRIACLHGHIEIVRILLNYNPSEIDVSYAIFHRDILKLLLFHNKNLTRLEDALQAAETQELNDVVSDITTYKHRMLFDIFYDLVPHRMDSNITKYIIVQYVC